MLQRLSVLARKNCIQNNTLCLIRSGCGINNTSLYFYSVNIIEETYLVD